MWEGESYAQSLELHRLAKARAESDGSTAPLVGPFSELVATVDVTAIGGTVWSDGHPGLGFWPVEYAVPEDYGWKAWSGGER